MNELEELENEEEIRPFPYMFFSRKACFKFKINRQEKSILHCFCPKEIGNQRWMRSVSDQVFKNSSYLDRLKKSPSTFTGATLSFPLEYK